MAFWPTSVATNAQLYIAVNALQTTLSGAINNSVTTITLASTTGFQTAGAVTIDNEVIFYTNISGADLTGCTRGADGTTAASHSSGVPVGATVVAFHHNGLKDEVIAIETSLNFTASRAMTSNSSGRLTVSSVTDTELGYLAGVTSAIQTQMNLKAPLASPTFTGAVTMPTPFTLGAVSVTATGTEMNYLVGVSSAIQTQLGLKAPLANPTFTGTVVIPTPFTLGAVSVTATGTEMNYLVGVSSAIQTQLGTKAADSAVVHNTGTETVAGSKTFSADTVFSSDVYTVAYVDYSGTSTVTGWSSFNTKKIYYKKVGKLVWVWFQLDGTSNATTISFTLPFATANTVENWTPCRAFNNGSDATTPGLAEVDPNSSTVTVSKDWTGAAWTASGRKIVTGEFVYHTA